MSDGIDVVKHEADDVIDQEVTTSTDTRDYNKLMEKYQLKFNIAYARSQSLWKAEKVQRRALYAYQRKVNALLELLNSYEEDPAPVDDDDIRILRLLEDKNINPSVKKILQPLQHFDEKTNISNSHRINLYLAETIPEVVGDEVDHLEVNPQEPEAWVRRHYPHLVVSKFRPVAVSSTFVQNSVDTQVPRPPVKRRRRTANKDSSIEQDTEGEEGSPQPKQQKKN